MLQHIMWYRSFLDMFQENAHRGLVCECCRLIVKPEVRLMEMNDEGGRLAAIFLQYETIGFNYINQKHIFNDRWHLRLPYGTGPDAFSIRPSSVNVVDLTLVLPFL